MSDFASALLLELGRATLAMTLAAGLALVVLRWAGLQSPRLHRVLWLLVLLVGCTFGGVPVAIPWHRAEPPREESPTIVASLPPAAGDALVELNVHAPPASEATPLEMPSLPLDATPPIFAAPLELSTCPQAEANQAPAELVGLMHQLASLPWPLLVVTAWLAGIGALAAVWLFGYIRFVRAIPLGQPCDEVWQQQWKLLLKQHSVRRPIAMRVTVDTGPLLCRLPRGYELLIPAALWTSLSPAERQSVLQHELAHYLRDDLAKSLVARILALPHWFNPCAWLAVRRFDEAAEWACDQAAAAPAEVTTYARALVRLGEVHLTTRYGSAARTRPLASRVRRLLKFQQKDSTMKTGLIVAAALCLAALAVVRVQLVAEEPEAPKESPLQPTIVTIEASQNDASPKVEPYLAVLQDEEPQPAPRGDETIDDLFKEPAPAAAKEVPAEKLLIKPNPKSAAQRAVDAAREAYIASKASWEADNTTLEEVCGWSKRWMTAAIGAATDPQQRIDAAKQHLERMKTFQEVIQKSSGIRGIGEPQQVTAINFYVAEAESQVDDQQARIGPTLQIDVRPQAGGRVVLEEVVEQLPNGQEVRRVVRRAASQRESHQKPRPDLPTNLSPYGPNAQPIPSSRDYAPVPPTAIPNTSKPPIVAPLATPVDASIPAQDLLRYDGKSFDEWATLLDTELSTASRTKALRALAAFGPHGHGPEVAKRVVDLMRGYNNAVIDGSTEEGQEEMKLVAAAGAAIQRLAPDDSRTAVLDALKKGNINQRLFALQVLGSVVPQRDELLELYSQTFKDDERTVREIALSGLVRTFDGGNAEVTSVVRAALTDPDDSVVRTAFRIINDSRKGTDGGAKLPPKGYWAECLTDALADRRDWVRVEASTMLQRVDFSAMNAALKKATTSRNAEVAKAAAAMLEMLQETNTRLANDYLVRWAQSPSDRAALNYLRGMGITAIPALEAASHSDNPDLAKMATKLLGEIREDAKKTDVPVDAQRR